MLLLMLACAMNTYRSGLLDVDGERLTLIEPTGRMLTLYPGSDDPELVYLSGCGVEIQGTQIGRRLTVRRWRVTDAGDGSQPFIGTLRRYGGQWVIDDWSTGTTLTINPDTLSGLESHDGQTVLIVGFVAGAHEVSVISWRSLTPGALP